MGCASADMLHAADDDDVAVLARAGVAAVVCPGTALQLGARPPVRALLDKGVAVALGTDHTPGRNGITSMALVISLAVSYLGMSVEEALRAATIGGAHALKAPDRGAMVRGRLADMVLWDADHEGAFVWSYGLSPRRVWRGGEPVTPAYPGRANPWHAATMPARPPAPAAVTTAPVTLVVGEEEFLVDRAVRELIAAARASRDRRRSRRPRPNGSALAPGELDSLTSPSLFGGVPLVVIRSAQNASKEVTAELTGTWPPGGRRGADPDPRRRRQGQGPAAAAKTASAQVIERPKVTRFAERLDFIEVDSAASARRTTQRRGHCWTRSAQTCAS